MNDRPLFTFAPAPAAAPAPRRVEPTVTVEDAAAPPGGFGLRRFGRLAGSRGWRAAGVVAAAGLLGLAAAPLSGSPAVAGCPCANRAAVAAPYGTLAPAADPYFGRSSFGRPAVPAAPAYAAPSRGATGWTASPYGVLAAGVPAAGVPATAVSAGTAGDGGFTPVPQRTAPQRLARVAAAPTRRQDDAERAPLTAPRPGDPAPPRPADGLVGEEPAGAVPPPSEDAMPPRPEAADPSFGLTGTDAPADAAAPAQPQGGAELPTDPEAIEAPEPIRIDAAKGGPEGDASADRVPLSPPSLPGLRNPLPSPYGAPQDGLSLDAEPTAPADPFAPTGPDVVESAPQRAYALPPQAEPSVRPLPAAAGYGAGSHGYGPTPSYATAAFAPAHAGVAGYGVPGYALGGDGPLGDGVGGAFGPYGGPHFGGGACGCGGGYEPCGVGCEPCGGGHGRLGLGLGFCGGLVPDSGCCGADLGWCGGYGAGWGGYGPGWGGPGAFGPF
ncbi:hypothetical protein [Alienimonas sp. DA493]|uniref:hypothetical protein n=1 Tax=Alienimonas sp. DA493 TaxID=3373605 RepID=UPI0037545750